MNGSEFGILKIDSVRYLKRLSRIILAVSFILAGANHFIIPQFYMPLIPDYLPFHRFINIVSGGLEIILGFTLLLAGDFWRSWAAMGIIILLLLFIPSHVLMIQQGGCAGEWCVGLTAAWIRLVLVHPVLLLWAYYHHKNPRA